MDGLVLGCGVSIADALEIPQSCTKPLIYVKLIKDNPMTPAEFSVMGQLHEIIHV